MTLCFLPLQVADGMAQSGLAEELLERYAEYTASVYNRDMQKGLEVRQNRIAALLLSMLRCLIFTNGPSFGDALHWFPWPLWILSSLPLQAGSLTLTANAFEAGDARKEGLLVASWANMISDAEEGQSEGHGRSSALVLGRPVSSGLSPSHLDRFGTIPEDGGSSRLVGCPLSNDFSLRLSFPVPMHAAAFPAFPGLLPLHIFTGWCSRFC